MPNAEKLLKASRKELMSFATDSAVGVPKSDGASRPPLSATLHPVATRNVDGGQPIPLSNFSALARIPASADPDAERGGRPS